MQPLPKSAPSFNPSVSEGGHDRVGAQACQGAEGTEDTREGAESSRVSGILITEMLSKMSELS